MIFLGETFSGFVTVHNDSQDMVKEVSLKVNYMILYMYRVSAVPKFGGVGGWTGDRGGTNEPPRWPKGMSGGGGCGSNCAKHSRKAKI